MAGAWVFAALISVGFASSSSGVSRPLFIVLAAVAAIAAVRAARAGIVLQGDNVLVRGFVTSRRVPWGEVADVAPSVSGGSACLLIKLRNGEQVAARGCASYSRHRLEELATQVLSARPA